jgi:hypothetical protein
MCQKVSGIAVMVHMLRLVIEDAKQTTVKWQENRASPEANVRMWTQQQQELPSSVLGIHATSLLNERLKF